MKRIKKQTAVEWLMEQLTKNYPLTKESAESIIKQAKEMEKEQIIDAYNNGQQIPPFEYAKKYYNETFKSE